MLILDMDDLGDFRRMDYGRTQHEEYLRMTEKVGEHWLKVFGNDTEFWSAVYWDLFTKLWQAQSDVRKTDALGYMNSVKSAHTAGKYLETAIRRGLIEERTIHPTHVRNWWVCLLHCKTARCFFRLRGSRDDTRRDAGTQDRSGRCQ